MRTTLSALALSMICAGAFVAAASEPGNGDVHASADVYAFMVQIAKPTAQAKMGDGRRAVTLVRTNGELFVSSLQVIPPGERPSIPVDTVAVLIVHARSECETPLGDDDFAASAGAVNVFVAGASGRLWEIGKVTGSSSIREIKGADSFGPWEPYQKDAANYVTYKCTG
jgi:hypothetical protein